MNNKLRFVATFCAFVVPFIAAPAPCDAQETTFMRIEDGFVERIEQNYEVIPDGSLTLDAEVGSVRVDSWTNDGMEIRIEKRVRARLEERARTAFDEIEVILSQRDNNVRIEVVDVRPSSFFRERASVEIAVRVPEFCTLDLRTVDGSIEIENTKGPVTANAVNGDIEIGPADSKITAGTTDGNIEIADVKGSITASAMDGDIEINGTIGQVAARTIDGDIEIRNTQGNVEANAVDGSVEIARTTGDVFARTTDGDIEVRNTQGAVDVKTVDGRIETMTTESNVDASTLEGDIGLFDARGYVSAQAARGSIEVGVARTRRGSGSNNTGKPSLPTYAESPDTVPPDADSPDSGQDQETLLELETSEGDVTIYLPSALAASIEAEGSSGGLLLSRLWRDEVGHIYSDFGLNQSEWGVFFYIQSEASGEINGGGDRIRLRTNSGNIYIKEKNR